MGLGRRCCCDVESSSSSASLSSVSGSSSLSSVSFLNDCPGCTVAANEYFLELPAFNTGHIYDYCNGFCPPPFACDCPEICSNLASGFILYPAGPCTWLRELVLPCDYAVPPSFACTNDIILQARFSLHQQSSTIMQPRAYVDWGPSVPRGTSSRFAILEWSGPDVVVADGNCAIPFTLDIVPPLFPSATACGVTPLNSVQCFVTPA